MYLELITMNIQVTLLTYLSDCQLIMKTSSTHLNQKKSHHIQYIHITHYNTVHLTEHLACPMCTNVLYTDTHSLHSVMTHTQDLQPTATYSDVYTQTVNTHHDHQLCPKIILHGAFTIDQQLQRKPLSLTHQENLHLASILTDTLEYIKEVYRDLQAQNHLMQSIKAVTKKKEKKKE